jgi:hypothetical protein
MGQAIREVFSIGVQENYAGECRREYMGRVANASGLSPALVATRSEFLANVCRQLIYASCWKEKAAAKCRRNYLGICETPHSSPGRALAGAVAQLVEHQTPFAGVVSPTLVAAATRLATKPIPAIGPGNRRPEHSIAARRQ